MITELCIVCQGSGLQTIERDGERYVRDCACRIERRSARLLHRSNIPKRYEHCSLDSFETAFKGSTSALAHALRTARKFVDSYPLQTQGTGLMLTGSVGVGKTHLATGILRELILQRGVSGIFYDYRELLKQVQNSYNRHVQITELEILAPVFQTEVLVLDELGAAKVSDWVWDTIAHILNTRYNECRTTIITTNLPNASPLATEASSPTAFGDARLAMRRETLGDRITERMQSRLQEMCVVVDIDGIDYRKTSWHMAKFG